ncbi:hypothetical protein CTA2_4881 [Colletotrichum tanaceti]|nr:hypothetical protein CTA2_4872 [Colletotrichum tanaceti]KAJ0166998.1 hypothetical protein CTA2_4881 [Colletotrichum tanaceti]
MSRSLSRTRLGLQMLLGAATRTPCLVCWANGSWSRSWTPSVSLGTTRLPCCLSTTWPWSWRIPAYRPRGHSVSRQTRTPSLYSTWTASSARLCKRFPEDIRLAHS